MMEIIKSKQFLNILLSVVFSILFILSSSNNLDAQGLYYDEVHQATASFAYIGSPPPYPFASLTFLGYPIMNMNYSGAIKTGIYGLFLKIFNTGFSIINWRFVGILFLSMGLILFGIIVRKSINPIILAVFYLLMITDVTVILTNRHDWGPVSLSMFFRLIFIAIWLKNEISGMYKEIDLLLLGLLVGISIFEKLSAVVLLFPLLLMFVLGKYKKTIRNYIVLVIGGILGLIPLFLANLLSFLKTNNFISFEFSNAERILTFNDFLKNLIQYFSLGGGELAQNFILGNGNSYQSIIECSLVVLVFIVIIYLNWRKKGYSLIQSSGIMLLSYFSIIVLLYILPKSTWIHHWIIGTPFQYAAFILALLYFQKKRHSKWINVFLLSLVIIFSSFRFYNLFLLEKSFSESKYSQLFDPALNVISSFAEKHKDDSLFIAGDWGLANQIYCYVNGESDVIIQPDWNYFGLETSLWYIDQSQKDNIYLVFSGNSDIDQQRIIFDELRESLGMNWKLTSIDYELMKLNEFDIHKFERRNPE